MSSCKENVFKNLDNVVISSGMKFVAVKFLTQETVYFGVEVSILTIDQLNNLTSIINFML